MTKCNVMYPRINLFLHYIKTLKVNGVLLPMALSDHKGVFCVTTQGRLSQRAARWRFNTFLLKNESYITQFIAEFQIFAKIKVGTVADTRILWDAIKVLSGAIPYYSALMRSKLGHFTYITLKLNIPD